MSETPWRPSSIHIRCCGILKHWNGKHTSAVCGYPESKHTRAHSPPCNIPHTYPHVEIIIPIIPLLLTNSLLMGQFIQKPSNTDLETSVERRTTPGPHVLRGISFVTYFDSQVQEHAACINCSGGLMLVRSYLPRCPSIPIKSQVV